MDLNMVRECGEALKETHIKVNGDMVRQKDMGFIHGQTVINMKDNSNNV